jgi:hypothetical protein
MKAKGVDEAGSLKAAVATIAARDYRKANSTLEEQICQSGGRSSIVTRRITPKRMIASSSGSRQAPTSTRSSHPRQTVQTVA